MSKFRRNSATQESLDLKVMKRPNRTGIKLLASALAGGLAVAMVFGSCERKFVKRERSTTTPELAVTLIEPVTFDMRARTFVKFRNQTKLNLKVGPVDLANDYKANTSGQVETLTGADARGVHVELAKKAVIDKDGKAKLVEEQVVHIPASSIHFFSRIVENKTTTTMEYDRTAEVGRSVWGFVAAVTPLDGVNSDLAKVDAELQAASRQEAVNKAQSVCGPASWTITQQAIRAGYGKIAQAQGIDPSQVRVEFEPEGAKPDFSGPYTPSKDYDFKTIGSLKCQVPATAYTGDVVAGISVQVPGGK